MDANAGRYGSVTCVMCAGVCPGHCAADVEVLEKCHAALCSEAGRRPAQSLRSGDGDPGLAGLEHHHHRLDVRDGDARVLTETPRDRQGRQQEGETETNISSWPCWRWRGLSYSSRGATMSVGRPPLWFRPK